MNRLSELLEYISVETELAVTFESQERVDTIGYLCPWDITYSPELVNKGQTEISAALLSVCEEGYITVEYNNHGSYDIGAAYEWVSIVGEWLGEPNWIAESTEHSALWHGVSYEVTKYVFQLIQSGGRLFS